MAWSNSGNKYNAEKIREGGDTFDSRKEYRRWKELTLLERAGEIANLRRQVEYVLIPVQKEPDSKGPRGGVKQGKVIERKCSYIADFVYTDVYDGMEVVEDAKGVRTEAYKIKKKLMLFRYGIRIKEV